MVEPGHTFSEHLTVRQDDIAAFAKMCGDFNPLHHDAQFAARTRFKGIIASGPHIMSLFTSMVATHFSRIGPMVGLEFSFKFIRPVRAGDELDMSWTVSEVVPRPESDGFKVHLSGQVAKPGEPVILGQGLILLSSSL